MNKKTTFRGYFKKIPSLSLALSIAILAITTMAEIHAQSAQTFLQTIGSISEVNVEQKSVTVAYPQVMSMIGCVPGPCPLPPASRSPDIILQDQILVMNAFGGVINDITTLKVDDNVTVYLKQNTPYAIKDSSMVPPGCNPLTGICGITGTAIPGGADGQPPIMSPTGPDGQPTVDPCTQGETFLEGDACPGYIQNDLSSGVQSDEVETLQKNLQSLGYFPNTIQPTGYFGPITKQAVIQYQTANGLPQTGYVGPLTRKALGY